MVSRGLHPPAIGFKPLHFLTNIEGPRELSPQGKENLLHSARTYLTHRGLPPERIEAVVNHIKRAMDSEGQGVVFTQLVGKKGGVVSPETYWHNQLPSIPSEHKALVLETVGALNLLHVYGNPWLGLHVLNELGLLKEENTEQLAAVLGIVKRGAKEILQGGPGGKRLTSSGKQAVRQHWKKIRLLIKKAPRQRNLSGLREIVEKYVESQRWPSLKNLV